MRATWLRFTLILKFSIFNKEYLITYITIRRPQSHQKLSLTCQIIPDGHDPAGHLPRVIVAHGDAMMTPLVLGSARRVVQHETRGRARGLLCRRARRGRLGLQLLLAPVEAVVGARLDGR